MADWNEHIIMQSGILNRQLGHIFIWIHSFEVQIELWVPQTPTLGLWVGTGCLHNYVWMFMLTCTSCLNSLLCLMEFQSYCEWQLAQLNKTTFPGRTSWRAAAGQFCPSDVAEVNWLGLGKPLRREAEAGTCCAPLSLPYWNVGHSFLRPMVGWKPACSCGEENALLGRLSRRLKIPETLWCCKLLSWPWSFVTEVWLLCGETCCLG